jgi:hypothetical protein
MTTAIYIALVIGAMLWWNYTEHISRSWLFHLLHGSLFTLLATTHYLLPATCEPAREITFVAAFTMASLWLFLHYLRLSEVLRRRRIAKQRAARPLQQHLCTARTTPCTLSFEALRTHLQEQPDNIWHGNGDSTFDLFETADSRFAIETTPLPDGGWLLALWDDLANEEFYNKELNHIFSLHGIAPSLIPDCISATALAICCNGQLHTYPDKGIWKIPKDGLLSTIYNLQSTEY